MTELELFRAKLDNMRAPELTKVVPLNRDEAEILIEKLNDTADIITADIIDLTQPKGQETAEAKAWSSRAKGAREHIQRRIYQLRKLWPDAAVPESLADHTALLEKAKPLLVQIARLKGRNNRVALWWNDREIETASEIIEAMNHV